MISSARARAKAAEWAARADSALEGIFKRRLERIARNWAALAVITEADGALEAHRRRGGRWTGGR
jgi:hypothetical protein